MNSFMIRTVSFQMEDSVLSIRAKIVEYIVGPILHHAKYLCCFNNFAVNLPNAKRELELTLEQVKLRVREATIRIEKIEPTVEEWLEEVEKVLAEVQILEGRVLKVTKSSFIRQCRYFLAKEMVRKIGQMNQLKCNKLEPFSRSINLPDMKYYSSKDFVLSNSTESTYNKLLETLKDKNVSIIGLVGIEGSGRTTLANEVGKKAEKLKLFEKVVMTTVSQNLNIISIQEQIADKLGFKLEEESEESRAKTLSQSLREGTTLLILDDVWEKLNFEDVGIPLNENNKSCVILLTTQSREICTSMQCQSIIELNRLTNEESWILFKLYANITDDSADALKSVAKNIVDECEGFLISIVTLGSTLKKKSLGDWKSALKRLQDSKPLVITKGLKIPHVCLQLSYDNLTDELTKSLLLLCSIFPKDHEIDLEDLFRFGRGLGLTKTSETMEKSRREIEIAVNILKDSCLLLKVSNKERVKMHDMVRDVALLMASERGQAMLASTAMDLRMLVEDETLKDKRAISLWDLKNGQLPNDNQLNCPTLEILLLHSPKAGFEVSNLCLERLKVLKILSFLTCGYTWKLPQFSPSQYILSLPQSIESLKNLQTLCLRGYKLGDISILESLQALEILDLRGSYLEELPNGIVELKKLKLLDLYNCWIEKNNAYEVVGRLQLEELYFHLFSYKEDIPHNVSFSRLQRYVIVLDHRPYSFHLKTEIMEEHRPSRALYINGLNASTQRFISLPIMDLFLRAEYLHLKHLKGGYKNLIPSMDQQGMNQLIALVLEYSLDIEYLFDSTMITTKDVFLSKLVTLRLNGMHGLQEVFHDQFSLCSLENLQELIIENCAQLYSISFPRYSNLCSIKVLRIYNCPVLTSLFMPSIVKTLVLLEVLKISECHKLKYIIEEVKEGTINRQNHASMTLPKLSIIDIEGCERLKYILPVCFLGELVSLQRMSIRKCSELMYVFGNEKEHDLSAYQHQSTYHCLYPNLLNLDTFKLDSLPNLVDFWPDYYRPRLLNLKEGRCTECPGLSNSARKVVIYLNLRQDITATDKVGKVSSHRTQQDTTIGKTIRRLKGILDRAEMTSSTQESIAPSSSNNAYEDIARAQQQVAEAQRDASIARQETTVVSHLLEQMMEKLAVNEQIGLQKRAHEHVGLHRGTQQEPGAESKV
ncbi:Disease resistance protein [Glycine soja]|uniref:Disease resistance protein n=2 Tax=Glycine soja TaxID=3848 RepID=A0A445HQI7_GLYSO|nr:Disease resistance protein [Glycine soja]